MTSDNFNTIFLLRNDADYSLFKFAINSAKKGLKIWFISVKPFEQVPKGIQQPCKDTLQLITFIYLNDFAALIRHLNSIHKWKNTPNIIILKSFDEYSNLYDIEYNSAKAAFIVASLLDCVQFLSKKNNSKASLLVSCPEKHNLDRGRLKVLLDMYFDNFLFDENLNEDETVEKIENIF